MKTLILYATKYGATAEIAQRIKTRLDESVLHDLKQDNIPDISEFDCVIIGSSLYAGAIRKEAKTFLVNHERDLLDKSVGLFLSGLDTETSQEFFAKNFPQELLTAAKATCFAGGVYDPKKVGWFGRFLMKAATKLVVYTDKIDDSEIERFSEAMRLK